MKKQQWLWAVFFVYVAIVLKLTVFRQHTMDEPQWNLSLFTQLIFVYETNGLWPFLRLFLGNIGWFVPFGFLIPFLWKKQTFWRVTAGGTLFSFVIEILQLLFRKGYCELDDLILNAVGCMLGYGFYYFVRKTYCNKRVKK